MIEISPNGEVTVREGIRGTYADPTIPLAERVKLFAEAGDWPVQEALLLCEAADHLQSIRIANMRRGRAQLVVQQQLHAAHQEIMFLRNYIWEQCDKKPEFIQPSPYDTEERRDASGRPCEGKE